MGDWTKVVTNPLGLAGFVLFLVFGYLSKIKRSNERRWISFVALLLAIAALIGGLAIAYVQVPKASQPSPQISQPLVPAVKQSSTGQGSPNVQSVQGNVTITVDQSKGKVDVKDPSAKKPTQESK
jgi:hypothetical protein